MKTQLLHIIFLLIINCLCAKSTHAQQLFHQDVFYGGVTSAGWSSGAGIWGSGSLEKYLQTNSQLYETIIYRT